jgi:transcriptional regulator with XRE-family HTH domain
MSDLHFHTPHHMAISKDERAFFVALGARIAAHRKKHDITQAELADSLGISQQAMNSFEKGRRRVPVSLLPVIAQTLHTTLNALMDEKSAPAIVKSKKRGPQKKIRQQLEQIETLPMVKQRAIAQVLDSMLGNQASP